MLKVFIHSVALFLGAGLDDYEQALMLPVQRQQNHRQ